MWRTRRRRRAVVALAIVDFMAIAASRADAPACAEAAGVPTIGGVVVAGGSGRGGEVATGTAPAVPVARTTAGGVVMRSPAKCRRGGSRGSGGCGWTATGFDQGGDDGVGRQPAADGALRCSALPPRRLGQADRRGCGG